MFRMRKIMKIMKEKLSSFRIKHFDKMKMQILGDRASSANLNTHEFDSELKQRGIFLKKAILQSRTIKSIKSFIEKIPIFSPSHPLILIWNFIQIVTIIIFFFFIPIHISVAMLGITLSDLMTPNLKMFGLLINFIDVLISMNSG